MNNSSNSKDYDEYVRSKIWRPFTTDKGGDYSKKSNNNVSQNRGSEVINKLTDYSDYVNMYSEILHYYDTEKYTVFPQYIHNACGKVSISGGKRQIKCIWVFLWGDK